MDLSDLLFDNVVRTRWRFDWGFNVVLDGDIFFDLEAALWWPYCFSFSSRREAFKLSLRYLSPCLSRVSSFFAIYRSMVGLRGLLVDFRPALLLLVALVELLLEMETLEDLFFCIQESQL